MLIDAVLSHYTLPTTMTTILHDWIKGRHSEVDEINGLVVREQERLGGDAPINRRITELASEIELGRLKARPENLALLLSGI